MPIKRSQYITFGFFKYLILSIRTSELRGVMGGSMILTSIPCSRLSTFQKPAAITEVRARPILPFRQAWREESEAGFLPGRVQMGWTPEGFVVWAEGFVVWQSWRTGIFLIRCGNLMNRRFLKGMYLKYLCVRRLAKPTTNSISHHVISFFSTVFRLRRHSGLNAEMEYVRNG